MKSLQQVFSFMNDISYEYVVLRNFDHLPYSVGTKGHGDLDLLVSDLKHFLEIFPEALPVYPHPRVMYKLNVGGLNIYMDVRHVGDGYYPVNFERAILETREYNHKGFYTPDPLHFRIGLSYHAVHHKNENNYKKWIGNLSVKEILTSLQKTNIGYADPVDPSVGRFNQYWKGATAIVENKEGKIVKKQIGFKEFSLISNERRILEQCDSTHFPKVIETVGDEIILENCGERLDINNLPDNWKEQLVEIVGDLKKFHVEHRDIKPDNLLIKDGVIKLCDFGWSRLKTDAPDNAPACLGWPYRASWGPDDNFAMRKFIKELEYQVEEAKCLIATN